MRRKVLEALTQPDIKNIAVKLYEAQLPDRSGRLGFDELRHALRALNHRLGVPMPTQAVAEQLFRRFDVNSDGHLNFDEFFELFVASLRRFAFDRSMLLGRDVFVSKQTGKVWENFSCVKKLGAGSFGAAYLVRDKRSGDERVVKAAGKSHVKLPVEDVEREIMVMQQIDHPHIVRLYEWYEGSNSIYLVLDALKGGTLQEVILEHFQAQGRGLSEDWIRTVIRQSIEAMAYCHSKRIIHKDLKDENIMLLRKDPDYSSPHAVIIDLGVSEMFGSSDPKGKMMAGTPTTMAPEVWIGTFGPKCDVWSLGCVLYELLAGDVPFCARSWDPKDWRALHKHGPNWDKVKTSKLSRDICRSMLMYTETDRPTMVACLDHKWFSAKADVLHTVQPQQLALLRKFGEETALKRALLFEIAARLPLHHAERIVKFFASLDENRDGSISKSELQSGFKKLGLKDEKLLEKIFTNLDVDGDGILSLNEFAAGVLLIFKDLLEDRFRAMFRKHDEDSDGTLNRRELKDFLANAIQLSTTQSKRNPAAVLDELLVDSNTGELSYEEVKAKLMTSAT